MIMSSFGYEVKWIYQHWRYPLVPGKWHLLRDCQKKGRINGNRNKAFYSSLTCTQKEILKKKCLSSVEYIQVRYFGLARVLRSVLKIRYIILGSAVGGGVQLSKKYEDWKDQLPDFKWFSDLPLSKEKVDNFRSYLINLRDKIGNTENGWLRTINIEEKLKFLDDWFSNATDGDSTTSLAEGLLNVLGPIPATSVLGHMPTIGFNSSSSLKEERDRLQKLQDELISVQMKYQKELEKLEKENKELRKQLMLKSAKTVPFRKIKKSLIDMYSEVLDELSDYDSSYNTMDHLPRVVVVGDQSAGKTSVLEMVAQARIFPRGAGEMMTRAPVKVTLSEGPYHIARFKDSSREFDLSKESELADLRREVELRMKNTVANGRTVSNEVISMTVKGPGLQRMVLVDLPGVICTATADMAEGTREAIRDMTNMYMSNPNAIILCIQDGSVDAERSIVTDLVSQMDPQGKRTILVLTKVDLAEENMADPNRIKRILEGRLLPLKALGYFAVVTGRGSKDDNIEIIKSYEEEFFRRSKLCREGILNMTQCTTQNLSFAVSDCFWKMVKASVEQQADAFKATRFNLETEWKNNFPRMRELDRDELFERARGEILDEVVNLSQLSPHHWEDLLKKKLWDKVSLHVFENIYLPAANLGNSGTFNTTIDIKLKHWADKTLPKKCVEVGWETLKDEFQKFMERAKSSKEHDDVFNNLKAAVVNEAIRTHHWEEKASDMLRVIQLNALGDRSVHDKYQWDSAVKFLEDSLKDKLQSTDAKIQDLIGPGFMEQWFYWKYKSPEQKLKSAIKAEVEKLISSDYFMNHSATLTFDELTTIRKNLQTQNIEVDNELVKEVWHPIYRHYFLKRAITKSQECKKGFYLYNQGLDSEMECGDVVLFWRIQKMLSATSNAVRQQIMNREARRLEKEIKDVLEDYSQDNEKKFHLLTGRRVELAEELKRVRQIQEKLEDFIAALNAEK